MARSVGIMAYSDPSDRLRLEALARLENISSSRWIVQAIRHAYQDVYGDTPPEQVVSQRISQSDEEER